VAYPGIFFWGVQPRNFLGGWRGGFQQILLRTEDRENGDLAAVTPIVRGFGGRYNSVQEISFHIVKFS
jgi:hypothetical protein